MMVSLEDQKLYTKGLEGDLKRANQRVINGKSIVKATKTANEAMQAIVDYWNTLYEKENMATSAAHPTTASSSILDNAT